MVLLPFGVVSNNGTYTTSALATNTTGFSGAALKATFDAVVMAAVVGGGILLNV